MCHGGRRKSPDVWQDMGLPTTATAALVSWARKVGRVGWGDGANCRSKQTRMNELVSPPPITQHGVTCCRIIWLGGHGGGGCWQDHL